MNELSNAEQIALALYPELAEMGIKVATGHPDAIFFVFPDTEDFECFTDKELCRDFYIQSFEALNLTMTTAINVQFRIEDRITAQMQFFPLNQGTNLKIGSTLLN